MQLSGLGLFIRCGMMPRLFSRMLDAMGIMHGDFVCYYLRISETAGDLMEEDMKFLLTDNPR